MAIGGDFGGGGGGFRLGPPNNLFGTTSGDASDVPFSISAAANRAAAEGVRDAYFTANAPILAQYDANGEFGIYLYYNDGSEDVLLGQTRAGGAWVTNATVVAVQAPSVVLVAPNATRWRVTVDNSGTLSTTQVT